MKVDPSVWVIAAAAVVGSNAAAHAFVADPDFDQAQNQLHPHSPAAETYGRWAFGADGRRRGGATSARSNVLKCLIYDI